MKVAYLVNQYPKVSHTFIRREIQAIERHGVEVTRFSLRSENFEGLGQEDKEEYRLTTFILNEPKIRLLKTFFGWLLRNPHDVLNLIILIFSTNKKSSKSFYKHIVCAIEASFVAKVCQKDGCQHIHAHFGTNSAEVTMYASLMSKISYSLTIHGPEEFDYPEDLNLREKVKRSKFIATVSSFGRSQLFRWIDKKDWDKVKVVHCGLEPSYFENLEPNKGANENVFLCTGRLCEQKGQLLLLQSFKEHLNEGHNSRLILAGDGELRSEIETLIKELELGERVTITGWISPEEVETLLEQCSVMVLPSFAEGLPVAIMEAMAKGRLVISTYIAGIPELVKHRKTGLLTVPGSIEDLTQNLNLSVSLSPEELKSIIQNAHVEVRKAHNVELEADKLAKLFEQ